MPNEIKLPIINQSKDNKEIVENNDEIVLDFFNKEAQNPIWLTISEAAKIGGIQNKTVRRAVQSKIIKYKIIGNKYLVDFASLIKFLYSTAKLKNKLFQNGIGQYIKDWQE